MSLSLKVIVEKGLDLMSMDTNGKSDPFVQLTHFTEGMKGVKVEKTKIVKKTLNPDWNETFLFENVNPKIDVLKVECIDYDRFTQNDSMGEFVINLSKMGRLITGETIRQDFPLEKAKKGVIRLSLMFDNLVGDEVNEEWKVGIGGEDEGKGVLKWEIVGGVDVSDSSSPYFTEEFFLKFISSKDGKVFGGSKIETKRESSSSQCELEDHHESFMICQSIHGTFDRRTSRVELECIHHINNQYWFTRKILGSFCGNWKKFVGDAETTNVSSEMIDAVGGHHDFKVGDKCKLMSDFCTFSIASRLSSEKLMKKSQGLF